MGAGTISGMIGSTVLVIVSIEFIVGSLMVIFLGDRGPGLAKRTLEGDTERRNEKAASNEDGPESVFIIIVRLVDEGLRLRLRVLAGGDKLFC